MDILPCLHFHVKFTINFYQVQIKAYRYVSGDHIAFINEDLRRETDIFMILIHPIQEQGMSLLLCESTFVSFRKCFKIFFI